MITTNGIFNGWYDDGNTWTYSSVGLAGTSTSSGRMVVTVNADVTSYIEVGTKISLVHGGTTKYFKVCKAPSYSAPNTTINLLSPINQADLSNTAFTVPRFSDEYKPFGFPSVAYNWAINFTDGTGRFQTNPDNVTVYNPGSLSIVIPMGYWWPTWKVVFRGQSDAAQTAFNAFFALSTANNASSDSTGQDINTWLKGDYVLGGASATLECRLPGAVFKNGMVLASDTTFYPVCWSTSGTAVMNSIGFDNGNSQMTFTALFAI